MVIIELIEVKVIFIGSLLGLWFSVLVFIEIKVNCMLSYYFFIW